jgi:hypothetical protein
MLPPKRLRRKKSRLIEPVVNLVAVASDNRALAGVNHDVQPFKVG